MMDVWVVFTGLYSYFSGHAGYMLLRFDENIKCNAKLDECSRTDLFLTCSSLASPASSVSNVKTAVETRWKAMH